MFNDSDAWELRAGILVPSVSASWSVLLAGCLIGSGSLLPFQSNTDEIGVVAQETTQHPPSFEAATIKPAKPDNYKPIGLYVYPGGRVYAGQSTLKMLVQYAFDVQNFQITGGPQWANEDMFEVSAVPPDSSESRKSTPQFINEAPTDEQRKMLQSLLIERFGLKFHRASKEGEVFYLVRGKGPLQLQKAKHVDYFPTLATGGNGYGGMSGQSISMSYMAMRLSRYLEHPVLDQTGLNGLFDFKLEPTAEDAAGESRNNFLDGIFQSVGQLGLSLKSGKGSIRMIVIDDVSRPTEN